MTHWIDERLLCNSTARLESDTLTIVASSCARKEPSTATAKIFQMARSNRSVSLDTLGGIGTTIHTYLKQHPSAIVL